MELLETFKQHLLGQKNASKITVKNYSADIRKFIRWFETTYQQAFDAQAITPVIAEAYKKQISASSATEGSASPLSVKRYLSSLKKFFAFLTAQGIVSTNPFAVNLVEQQESVDPWRLKDFKNYLYAGKASKLTIKNYLIDVQQFLTWFYAASQAAMAGNNRGSILGKITTDVIEEYKNRLITDAKLSPVSVNRKLSSLRKYTGWIASEGIIRNELDIQSTGKPANTVEETAPVQEAAQPAPAITLESFAEMKADNEQELPVEATDKQYSRIPFIRLGQKIGAGLNFLFEMAIILPFSKVISTTRYSLWKAAGREVFKPLPEVVKAYGETIPAQIEAVVPVKTASNVALATAKILSLLDKLLVTKGKTKFGKIKNFPKSLYAPLSISTTHLPWTQKLLHHIRYTRPAWYRKYHSYAFAHYLHVGVLLIFVTVTSVSMYQALFAAPRSQKPALAALPTAPPRILSFQGRLTDSSNTPLTAATPLRFGIYSNPTASGSALLWQETQNVTPDENGIFSALLGKNNQISQSLFANNASLYLGVTVGNDTELLPRQQLATVAYAANAETLQGLLPITKPNAGTANVVLALDSSGNLTMGGSANPTFQATGGQFTLSGRTLLLTTGQGSNTNVQIVPDGKGIIDMQKPIQNTSNSNNIASARGAVEVDDLFAILATSSGQSAFTVNQNSTGPIISASAGGVAKFTVSNAGAGTFASNLAVNGNSLTTTATTFSLLNTAATTVNFGGAATFLSIGASSGTTSVKNNLAVNGTTTFGGQTYSWPSSQSNGSVLQTNGSGQLTWVSLGSIGGGWQNNSGALSPINTTNDLLVGGSATSSALFQVSGLNGNITTSGSITAAGNLAVNGGTITTGGDLTLSPGGSNVLFSDGTTLNVGGASAASFNFFANSTSGNNTASGDNDLYVEDNLEVDGPIRFDSSSITLGNSAFANCSALQTINGTVTCGSGGSTTGGGIDSANGAAYIGNTTLDFLVGGTATSSAKFGLTNVNSGTPTLSISANNGSNSTYLSGDGVLGTTNGQNVTIGSATSGNVSLAPAGTTALTALSNGNVGIGTATPNNLLQVSGTTTGQSLVNLNETGGEDILTASANGTTVMNLDNAGNLAVEGQLSDLTGNTLTVNDNLNLTAGNEYQVNGASVLSATTLGTGVINSSLSTVGTLSSGAIASGFGSIDIANTITGTTLNGTNGINTGAGAGTQRIDASGNLNNIGTITAGGLITANGGVTVASGQAFTLASLNSNNNSVLYTDASGLVNAATTTTSGECLLSTGNTPTWGACPGSSINNYWQVAAGAIYPENSTVDFLVGGNATASAKFSVTNVNSGTPTASLSGETGGTSLTATGNLQTTNNQSLTIGGGTTGDITLSPQNGAGTVNSTGNLNLASSKTYQINGVDVLSSTTLGASVVNSSLTSVGTINSGTWNGTAIGAQYGGTGLNTSGATGIPTIAGGTWSVASTLSPSLGGTGDDTSGTTGVPYLSAGNWQYETQLNPARGGTGVDGSSASNGQILIGNGSGFSLANLTAGSGISITNGAGSISISSTGQGATQWTEGNGVLRPNNSTEDVLFGGTATSSAKFGILNMNAGTPTASLSGATGGLSIAANGTLQATNNQGLTIGGNTTGDITLSPQNGSGKVLSTGTMNLASGKTYQINGTDVLSATTLGTGVVNSSLTSVGALASGSIANGFGTIATGNTITGTTINGTTGINSGAGAGTQRIDASGNLVNIGTVTASGLISANGGLTVANGQNTTLASFTSNNNSVLYTNGSGVVNAATTASTGQCLLSTGNTPTWGACPGESVTNTWQTNNGALSPTNNTTDVLVGGTATNSAKFGLLNVNSGTPTASISANNGNNATFLTGAGNLGTTNGQTLTLGGTTTGNVMIDSGSGLISLADNTTLAGNFTQTGVTTFTTGTGQVALNGNVDATNGLDVTGASLTVGGANASITTAGAISGTQLTIDNLRLDGNTFDSTTGDITIDAAGNDIVSSDRLTIGSLTPGVGKLNVTGAETGQALAIFNETGNQNILTASASGTTVMNLDRSGNLAVEGQLSDLSGTTLNVNDNLSLTTGNAYQINGTSVLSSNTLGSGVTTSSLTSVGTITTGTWNATAIGTQYGGTGQNWSAVAQGAIPYFNGTGTMTTLSAGTAGQCLVTNGAGANPSWSNCGASTNFFNSANGALYAGNTTQDFLIGGTATSSAKFGLLNVNSGTPTASISGSSGANSTFLTGLGVLGTTNKRTLTLGATSTGNVALAPGGTAALTALANGNIGIGTSAPNEGGYTGTTLTLKDPSGNTPVLESVRNTTAVDSILFTYRGNNANSVLAGFDLRSDLNDGTQGTIAFQTRNGSGLAERMRINGAGQMGLGTTDPSEKLDVIGNMQVENAVTATKNVRLRTSGLSTDVEAAGATMVISTWSGANFTGTQYSQFVFDNNGADIFASRGLDVTGNVQLNLAGSSNNFALCHENNGASNDQVIKDCSGSPTSDYAEMYATAGDVAYGDVVTIGNRTVKAKALDDQGNLKTDGSTVDDRELVKANTEYDPQVIGIISNNYGDFSSTGHGRHEDSDHPLPVALSGRVPVKMASTSATIKAGDYITTSSQAGRAMKATKAGQVIGKALEDWAPGKDTVLVFVNNFWYNPSIQITADGDITIKKDVEDMSKKISSLEATINGASTSATPIASGAASNEALNTLSATVSALQTTVATHEVSMKDLENQIIELKKTFINQATESAFLKDLNTPVEPMVASSASELKLETLDVKNATVSEDLSVMGKTTVNNLGITGTLTAGVLSIKGLDEDGNAAINTMAGDLKIQSNGVGGVDMVAGKFKLDNKGNLNLDGNATFAKDVTVKGKLSANNGKFTDIAANALKIVRGVQADTSATETHSDGSAGSTVIKAHETQRTVVSPHVGKDSLIYITATSNTQGVVPYVARQAAEEDDVKGSFTIEIPESVQKDIKINWWIVN